MTLTFLTKGPSGDRYHPRLPTPCRQGGLPLPLFRHRGRRCRGSDSSLSCTVSPSPPEHKAVPPQQSTVAPEGTARATGRWLSAWSKPQAEQNRVWENLTQTVCKCHLASAHRSQPQPPPHLGWLHLDKAELCFLEGRQPPWAGP